MRKIIFIVMGYLGLLLPLHSQVIFLENFETIELNGGVGDLPDNWILYNDNNIPDRDYTYCNKAWKVIQLSGDGKFAVSPSWFKTTNTKADRWMISPEINLPENSSPFLCFKAKSADKMDKETYFVGLSKTDSLKTSFTDTLLWVNKESSNWTEHVLNLESFNGENVNIAFVLRSTDKYALHIDDIEILDLTSPVVKLKNLTIPTLVNKGTEISFNASANFKFKEDIHSYRINYSLNDTLFFSVPVENAKLPNFTQITIPNQMFTLNSNGVYTFKLWLSNFNNITNVHSDTISQQIEATDRTYFWKRTLLECFSSSTCSPCAKVNPYIKQAFENLQKDSATKEQIFILKYQVDVPSPGDPAYTDEAKYRFSYYNANGVPKLFLNGKTYSVGEKWENLESDLRARISKEWVEKTPFNIKASMDRKNSQYKVSISIENVGEYPNPVLLYLAFVEDSIFHPAQTNGETKFYHVMRKLLPDAYGQNMLFKSSGDTTIEFNYTFDMVKPLIFHGLNGVSALVYLQDNTTKEILQSYYLPAIIDHVSTKYERKLNPETFFMIHPNPSQGESFLDFHLDTETVLDMEICDLNGKIIFRIPSVKYSPGKHTQAISFFPKPKGIYYLKINSEKFRLTKKIIIQ